FLPQSNEERCKWRCRRRYERQGRSTLVVFVVSAAAPEFCGWAVAASHVFGQRLPLFFERESRFIEHRSSSETYVHCMIQSSSDAMGKCARRAFATCLT